MLYRQTTETTIENFVKSYALRTYVDPRFQRKKVWKVSSKKGFRTSVIDNTIANPIILVSVESCIERAEINKNQLDLNYFTKVKENGHKYISIDGNNRTSYCLHEWNSIDKENMSSEEEIFFRERQIPITIFRSCSREDMHLIAIRTNKGIAWNKQEDRNAIYGYVSDFIRDISVEMSTNQTSQLVLGLNPNRMQDDELFATMLAYHQHPTTNLSSSLLTSLYKRQNIDNEKEFKTIMSAWSLVVKNMGQGNNKVDKSLVVNLFIFLYEIYHNSGRKINEKTIEDFSKVYVELEGKRLLEIDSWKDNLRYANKKLKEKSDKILTDFIPYVDQFFIKLDGKRLFNIDDKIKMYKQSGGVVKRPDGTEVQLSVLQVLNGDLVHADHVDPYIFGGETTLENGQLLLKTDNLKKSKKLEWK
jgi:hypothetical protein